MAVRRSARWALIATGALVVLLALALFIAPPIVARHVLQHYLATEGVTADIGHVSVDILTGRISLDNVHGHGPGGRDFRVGHLAVDLDYPSLLTQRIDLTSIRIARARVAVGRDADGQLTVAGVPINAESAGGEASGWGFGLGRLKAEDIGLRYRAPAHDDQPAVDQTLDIARLHIGTIATWQPDRDTDADARLHVADGDLEVNGQLSPLGAAQRARLTIKASDFSMKALTPLARLGYITRLDGTFDADQKLAVSYGPHGELTLELDGRSRWRNAHLEAADGTRVRGDRLAWRGNEMAHLWQNHDQAGHITAKGRVELAGVRARRADQFDFRQQSATWNGQAEARLGGTNTRVTSNGRLTAEKTHLASSDGLALSSESEHLDGGLDFTLTPDETRIDTDGGFKASGLSFAIADTLDTQSAMLDWQGKTTIRLAGNGTHIHTRGSLDDDRLAFDVPETSHVTAEHVEWKGDMRMHSAAVVSRSARGRLTADHLHLSVPGKPIRMSAVEFGFDGRYAETPDNTGRALHLTVTGNAHSHKMRVMNTAIEAPWVSLLETDATDIDIDGIDSIGLGELKVSGIRVLDDKDMSNRFMQAVTLDAKQFALHDLAHYSLHDLKIGDAIIHLRHNAHGLGVVSRFVNSMADSGHGDDHATSASDDHSSKGSDDGASSPAAAASTTLAVDHLHLSGPALTFVDTTTTPKVDIHGANLDLTVDGLNTARPDQKTRYTLGLDVGAYGHFDSRGWIAPRAPEGMHMSIKAWLRSLALPPLSGYLNAAMDRTIGNGVADGTLHLSATKGQIDGMLDTTVTNFRLSHNATEKTDIAFGISMDTALKLIRGRDDIIGFKTKLLGDISNPHFSLNNLVREGVLAGLRTALLSNYSPLGLLNNAKNFIRNLFRSVEDRPAIFAAGMHYVRPDDRRYLALIAKAMREHPGWKLHVSGHAVPADIAALKLEDASPAERHRRLEKLARQRQEAARDYLTARNVIPTRIVTGAPTISDNDKTPPSASFSLDKG